MVALPESRPEDDEDVVWGLSTASALWARGERRDAIVWLRRAAEAAAAAGQEFRGSELGMYAGELEDMLNASGAVDGAPLADADAVDGPSSTGTGLASAEVIELLDVESERPSQASIDVEEDATLEPEPDPPSPPPARVAPQASVPPPAAGLSAPRAVSVPPPPPPRAPHPSSPPRAASGAPPVASPAPAVMIPPSAPLGVAAPAPHPLEVTPVPSSSTLRGSPTSRRLTPEPRKSQPRSPILDPWAEETLDGGAVARPRVSFQQGDGGEELVLPRRPQPVARSQESDDDEVVTSAAPLDASLSRKVQPRPPRKPAPKPSVPAEAPSPAAPPPAPGQLAQSAAAVPSKGPSAPPPPPAPSASVPASRAIPPAAPSRSAAPPAPPPPEAPPALAAVSPASKRASSVPPPPAVSKPAAPSSAPTSAAPPKLSVPPPATARSAVLAPKPSAPPPPLVAPAAPRPAPPAAPVALAPPAAPKRSVPPPPPSVAAASKSSGLPAAAGAAPATPSPIAPSPAAPPSPPSASAIIDGVPLDEVDAFSDLPPDMQHRLVALARVESLSADEEVSSFGAALLLAGEASVCATIVDTPACRAVKGTLVPSHGSLAEAVGIRVVAGAQGAKVAIWEQAGIEEALKSCPWVLDELVSRADRIQALAGATMGALGEIDEVSRNDLLDRLAVHYAQPGESLVEAGGETLGLAIVGGGAVDLDAKGATAARSLHPGELLFARAVLAKQRAPRGAHAGASGALVLIGEAKIARELMTSSPPLASLFADALE